MTIEPFSIKKQVDKDCNAMSSMQCDELALMFMVKLHCIDGIYKALSNKRLLNPTGPLHARQVI